MSKIFSKLPALPALPALPTLPTLPDLPSFALPKFLRRTQSPPAPDTYVPAYAREICPGITKPVLDFLCSLAVLNERAITLAQMVAVAKSWKVIELRELIADLRRDANATRATFLRLCLSGQLVGEAGMRQKVKEQMKVLEVQITFTEKMLSAAERSVDGRTLKAWEKGWEDEKARREAEKKEKEKLDREKEEKLREGIKQLKKGIKQREKEEREQDEMEEKFKKERNAWA
ncbi:hypothetical protein EDC01DRAFT_732221 [Geopyxis carbonaria]|nr:hypothetical protein EDC01DRAFT_732221 [Geopyxis carbonaria]